MYELVMQTDLLSENEKQEDIALQILALISTHMGQWNTIRNSNEELPKPSTKKQAFVHLCDYVASRKTLDIVSELCLPASVSLETKEYFAIQN